MFEGLNLDLACDFFLPGFPVRTLGSFLVTLITSKETCSGLGMTFYLLNVRRWKKSRKRVILEV